MRNQAYEQMLERQGVQWEYLESLPLDQIDAVKSIRNQARLDTPLDEELIDSYAAMDRDGSESPPLVLWRPGKGKWVLIDGNQRYAAKHRNMRQTTDAYTVLSQDPRIIDRLTWTWNNLVNGRRITQDEAMEHAVSYVRKYGLAIKDAAKEWGVGESTLSMRLKIEEGRTILGQRNIRLPIPISDKTVKVLSPLIGLGEDIFADAAMAVSSIGATGDDIEDLVRNIKAAKTSEAKAEVIQQFLGSDRAEERKAETRGGKLPVRRNLPRERFLRLLRELRNLTDDYQPVALRPLQSDYEGCRTQAADIVRRLTQMFTLGEIPEKARLEAV